MFLSNFDSWGKPATQHRFVSDAFSILLLRGIAMASTFSAPCSHVRVQGARAQLFGSAAADGADLEVRTAGDRI
jgi:hypothetical protein